MKSRRIVWHYRAFILETRIVVRAHLCVAEPLWRDA